MVGLLARRLRLPYTVGLLVAGLIIAVLRKDAGVVLTSELLFNVLLPPLLFEASLYIHWRELKKDIGPVGVLATAGVIIAAAVVGISMRFALGWPWTSAILFGVIISATDPVAVIMTFKDIGATGRLRLLVESESLLNDGVAATLFGVAVLVASGAHIGAPAIAGQLAWSIIGGVTAGLLCGAAAALLIGRTEEHLIETTFTAVAAYGSFMLAERLQCSPVLATVAAGMYMGNAGMFRSNDKRVLSDRGIDVVVAFWDVVAFLINSLIFLLMGITAVQTVLPQIGPDTARIVFLAIAAAVAGRALTVYPLSMLFARGPERIERAHQHVLFWGGLRGALALALTFSLPESLPYRLQITQATFGVVAFSILVQGSTITALLRCLDILPKKG